MNRPETPDDPHLLRKRAERIVRNLKPDQDLSPHTLEDLSQVIHELSVHEIELELQGEELQRSLQELETSRSLYERVFDLAPLPIFRISTEGFLLEANLKAHDAIGIPRHQQRRKGQFNLITSMVHPRDAGRFREALRAGESGQPSEQLIRLKGSDGYAKSRLHIFRPQGDVLQGILVYASNVQDLTDLAEELEAERARLECILMGTQLATWEWDLQNDHLTVNEQWRFLLEDTPDEWEHATQADWMSRIHPEDVGTVKLKLLAHLEGKESFFTAEFRMRNAKVDWIWVQVRGKRYRQGSDLHEERMYGVLLDITQAKQNLLELEQKRETLEAAFETEISGYWDCDFSTGEEYYSTSWKRMLGYEEQELANRVETWQELIFPEDLQASWEMFQVHLDSRGSIPYRKEVRYRHKDGHTVWVICSGKVIRWTEEGEPLRMVGSHIDITRTKEMQQENLRALDLLRRTTETGRIGTWEVDLTAGTVYWDEVTRKIHRCPEGYSPMLEQGIAFYAEGWSRDRITEVWTQAVEQGEKFDEELMLVCQDGVPIWVRSIGIPVLEDGTVVKIYGLFQDIDRQKCYEEELITSNKALKLARSESLKLAREADVANRAKSEFLANMSHEIRTPLNGIVSMTELLQETGLDTEQQEFLDILQNSNRILMRLVEDILDFSKLEAATLTLQEQVFELHSLLSDVLEPFSGAVEEKGLWLHQTPSGIPADEVWLVGDKDRLQQVLQNLVGNAVKFTREGGIDVHTFIQESKADSVRLMVEVRDTGIGIPPGKQEEIFAKFTQVSSSLNREHDGAGLGLAIAQNLAHLMGGTLRAESEVGVGSTFRLQIECKRARTDAPQQKKTKRPDSPLKDRFQGLDKQILLVEDNPTNQQVAQALLRKLGLKRVQTASSGGEAIALLRNTPCDLIFMDVQMPGMNGLEATRRIRSGEAGKEATGLPIISMTAHAYPEYLEAALQAGMNDTLTKPVSPEDVCMILTTYLTPGSPAPLSTSPEEQIRGSAVPLDWNGLLKRLMGDKGMAVTVLNAFQSDLQKDLGALQELNLTEAEDRERARRIFHRIKGASANVSARELHRLAAELERVLEQNGNSGEPGLKGLTDAAGRFQCAWKQHALQEAE